MPKIYDFCVWRRVTTTLINTINYDYNCVKMERKFHVLIEQDEDGGYIGKVPELQGCLSQGDTLDELMKNIREAIELCLEVGAERKEKIYEENAKFVGVQEIVV